MIFLIFNSTLYSSALSLFTYLKQENKWNFQKGISVVAFWNFFMLPSGLLWGKINDIGLNYLGIKKIMRRSFLSKKYLFFDIFVNHFGFQLIFIPSYYYYFKYLFGEKENVKKKEIEIEKKNINSFSEFIKDGFIFRIKLTAIGSALDIWLSKGNSQNSVKAIKTKNLAIHLIWNLFVINKINEIN